MNKGSGTERGILFCWRRCNDCGQYTERQENPIRKDYLELKQA
jgi:hypothetical protein